MVFTVKLSFGQMKFAAKQTLSAREREVLVWMVDGHTPKGNSEHLGILPDTVKKHRTNLLGKMEIPHFADPLAMCKGLNVKIWERPASELGTEHDAFLFKQLRESMGLDTMNLANQNALPHAQIQQLEK